ncbi:MAG: DUF115 domain-containing protein [Spirochaetia bacterium]|nr:DUF115 domain-containing protein [Spirochaetia bacterium]
MPENIVSYKLSGALGKYLINYSDGQYQIGIWDEKIKTESYLPLVSKRDSKREADKILGNFIIKEGILVLLMGMASVPLIEALIRQQEKYGGYIILFEADLVLAEYLANQFIKSRDEIAVITPHNIEKLNDFLEIFSAENIKGHRIFSLASSKKLASKFYEECEIIFKQTFSSLFSDLLTRLEFEISWIYNSIAQIVNFQRAYPVKKLFSKGNGYTAFLVSSGPSLRESLDILKTVGNDVFVACVDSAYRVLYRSGIKPHLVISLDAQAYTTRHFLGLPMGKKNDFPILYADIVSNPQVTTRWKGPLYLGTTAQYKDNIRSITPGCDFLEEKLLLKNATGDIQSGGSVATSLFDLLRLMNFENIIFIGQDLAYSYREIHSMGTHHSDAWLSSSTHRLETIENINNKVLHKRHISFETSLQNRKIPADYVLSLYRGWFSEAIGRTEMNVYNMTKEGLPIENVKKINLSDFQAIKKKNVFFNDFITSSASEKTEILDAKKAATFYKDIQNENFNDDTINEFSFLQKIGRKFALNANRLSGDETKKNRLLQKQVKEQEKFWRLLQRKSKSFLSVLEILSDR